MTRDYGFAPNPYHGCLTLATCKPNIRRKAVKGDIIIGCGSAANNMIGRAIFIARVSDKFSFQQYWDNPLFRNKRPFYGGSVSRAFGDNIYHHASDGSWIQEMSHHSYDDGSTNFLNLNRDTSSDFVLSSNDFVYYGSSAIVIPPTLRNLNGEDLFPKSRDLQNHYSLDMINAVNSWFAELPRNIRGRPHAW